MTCPSCNGDDWKLASFVHKEGLSRVNTTTRGSAVGLSGGGLGFGTGSARTTGTQQSALSKAASPPSGYPLTILLSIVGVIAFIIALFNGLNGLVFWLVAGACGFGIYRVFPGEKQTHNAKMAAYQVTRMCQRCGTLYVPS